MRGTYFTDRAAKNFSFIQLSGDGEWAGSLVLALTNNPCSLRPDGTRDAGQAVTACFDFRLEQGDPLIFPLRTPVVWPDLQGPRELGFCQEEFDNRPDPLTPPLQKVKNRLAQAAVKDSYRRAVGKKHLTVTFLRAELGDLFVQVCQNFLGLLEDGKNPAADSRNPEVVRQEKMDFLHFLHHETDDDGNHAWIIGMTNVNLGRPTLSRSRRSRRSRPECR